MILLDMGINEPVRVCDSCYRSRPEKRHSRIFEDSQFKAVVKDEDHEAAQMKKAIELSLQEEKRKQPLCEDEEALKKAIDASLKESTNSRESATITIGRLEHFNEIELENIAMFHQLIGRLVRTRPTLSTEDAIDLRNLAIEMERLQQRPIESESIRQQLDESIKGYRIVFGPIPAVNTPSSSSDTSNNLNQLRTEVITSSQQPTQSQTSEQAIQNQTAPIQPPKQLEQSIQSIQQTKLPENPNSNPSSNSNSNSNSNSIRNRLGSLSLENQIEHSPRPTVDFTQRSVNVKPYASLSHDPIPFAHSHQSPPPQIISNSIYPQQSSTSISSASFSAHQPQHFHPPHPQQQQLLMCPEMTIHPHPVHSFTHENPYAKLSEDSIKKKDKKKKKKKKKEKKRSDSIDSENCGDGKKREHKEKEKTSKNPKKSKRSKDKETKEPKEKKESKEKKEKKNTSKSNNQESNDEGRKSPLNLIDL